MPQWPPVIQSELQLLRDISLSILSCSWTKFQRISIIWKKRFCYSNLNIWRLNHKYCTEMFILFHTSLYFSSKSSKLFFTGITSYFRKRFLNLAFLSVSLVVVLSNRCVSSMSKTSWPSDMIWKHALLKEVEFKWIDENHIHCKRYICRKIM